MMGNDYTITLGKKKYAVNFDKIKEYCLISSSQSERETELTEQYTLGEEGYEKDGLTLSNRIVTERKTSGNPQDDMIIYDIVKLFLVNLLSNEQEPQFGLSFSSSLAFNTLLKYEMITEV